MRVKLGYTKHLFNDLLDIYNLPLLITWAINYYDIYN